MPRVCGLWYDVRHGRSACVRDVRRYVPDATTVCFPSRPAESLLPSTPCRTVAAIVQYPPSAGHLAAVRDAGFTVRVEYKSAVEAAQLQHSDEKTP